MDTQHIETIRYIKKVFTRTPEGLTSERKSCPSLQVMRSSMFARPARGLRAKFMFSPTFSVSQYLAGKEISRHRSPLASQEHQGSGQQEEGC